MCLALIVFLGQLAVVLMRYLLGFGLLEVQDAVNYAFAVLVALSIVVTFDQDRHVRVDVFRQKWSPSVNFRIDGFGWVFLALPVFSLMAWAAYPLVQRSWAVWEGAAETGGLPGLFLVKTCLLILPVLIIAHALKQIFIRFRRSS